MNILITGANRGLGLAFVRFYLQHGDHVWACYRSDMGGLTELASQELTCLTWDVSSYPDTSLLEQLPDRLDLVINNAGIYGPGKAKSQSLDRIRPEDMMTVFDIDCVGALRVIQSVKDRVIRARGTIANVSSRMGSSADNTSGGCYAYRAAKAAMVIVSKSMAIDLEPEGVHVITLHPGWVRTGMTDNTGEIDADESVKGLCTVIDQVTQYEPGSFVTWDGEVLPY